MLPRQSPSVFYWSTVMSKTSENASRAPDCAPFDSVHADTSPVPFAKLVRRGGRSPRAPMQHAIGPARCAYSPSSGDFAPLPDDTNALAGHVVFTVDANGDIRLENHCEALACRVGSATVPQHGTCAVPFGAAITVGVDELTVGLPSAAVALDGTPPSIDLTALGNALPRSEPAGFADLAALACAGSDAGAALAVFDDEPLGLVAPVSPNADDGDPLEKLLAEYRRALIHRERDYAHELKEIEQPQIAAPLPDDPFLDAPGRYRTGSLLSDLLDKRQKIDFVLDGMNPFLAEQLFVDDARHDVLLLLAPAHRQRPHFASAALLARHEHHLISVDSHFPMLNTITDTSTTERHDDERP
ncbi:TagK domain-containing protein [Burkholderia ubonensis]|uniref:TagK domain-containing protein n=1 Tax=Burkholderia ubonensis TaxID=101571 RepID=UPI001E2A56AE|nr:TagK domain-containing protein [Burkholderia ubonensis]